MKEDRSTGHALKKKGELSRDHHERDTGQRVRGWVITSSDAVPKALEIILEAEGIVKELWGKGVIRLTMHFRDTTLSAIHSFVL